MRRQDGELISRGLIDLGLAEVARFKQPCTREIGASKPGAGEIGAVEKGFGEVGASKIGAVEPRIAEVGVPEIRRAQIGACQRGKTQGGVPQPCRGEVDRPAIDRTHLPLADAEGDVGQAGNDRGILRTPCVPGLRPAAQEFDMAGVLRQGIHVTRQRETNRDVMIRAP